MPLREHLLELRRRLVWSVGGLVVTTLISLAFTRRFLEILISPMGNARPQSLRPAENILVYFKVAIILGVLLDMPILLYHLFAFIVPGLTKKEKRLLAFVIPAATLLFGLGVAFASLVMLPFSLSYLQQFLSDLIQPNYSIDYYISFVSNFVLWVGLSFESPLIIAFIARVGLVSPKQLLSGWRYAIVIIAIIAAVITPTPDPFNMTLVMAPLVLLYGLGILLAHFSYRPRPTFGDEDENTENKIVNTK